MYCIEQKSEELRHRCFSVRSELHYYVQKLLSPAHICNIDMEDWLPTGLPSASRRGYRRLWGRWRPA